jgi:hypothetical protein
MPTVRTFAPVMMHAYIARVAVSQFFEYVAAILIAHRSARSPKHHLLEFLGYLSHFSGGQVVILKLTFGLSLNVDKSSSFLSLSAQARFLWCVNPRRRPADG